MKKIITLSILILLIGIIFGSNYTPEFTEKSFDKYIVFLKWDVPESKISEIKSYYHRYISIASSFASKERYLDAMRKSIHKYLEEYFQPRFNSMFWYIKKLGGKPLKYIVSAGAVVALLTPKMVDVLSKHPLVSHIIKDVKLHVTLNVAVPTLLPNEWYNHGYNGSNDIGDSITGIEVAICDTGIYKDHPALAGKVIDEYDATGEGTQDDHGHGTLVAGVVASNDATYRGIAPGVNLLNAKCMDSNGEGDLSTLMDAVDWAVGSATDTAEIINTSLGGEYTADGESDMTKYLDKIVSLYQVIWVTASGNINPSTGYNKVNIPGDNYNGITVGATNDKGTTDRSDDSLASFSCVGPTDDNRIKPDLVAPGTAITSTDKDGGFTPESGTSFATPLVSGAAALIAPYMIEQFGDHWYLAVKALLLNSADDMGDPGPDGEYGWGYVNLRKAWESHNYTDVIKLSTGEMQTYSTYLTTGDKLTITAVWDRVYKRETLLGDIQFYDLSDFSIKVYNENGDLVAESDSTRDNVRRVEYTADSAGVYIIIIETESIDSQLVLDKGGDYVAISSNIALVKGILNVNTTLETTLSKTSFYDSETVSLHIFLNNTGNETIENAQIKISSYKLEPQNNETIIDVGSLEPGEATEYDITLKPVDVGDDLLKVILIGTVNGVRAVINATETKVDIQDDDSTPPKVAISSISGSGIILTTITIKVTATDESGIRTVILLYSIDSEVTLDNYQGKLVLNATTPDQNEFTFKLQIDIVWIGKKIYFAAYAIDNDNDRPNDSINSTLTVNYIFNVPLELNLGVTLGPLILLAIIASVISSSKKKPKKVRTRRIESDVIYI